MHVHRHAAPVVRYLQRAVLKQDNLYFFGISGNGFIHAIVNDLLGHVIGALCIRIHARAAAYGIESFQNFHGIRIIRR